MLNTDRRARDAARIELRARGAQLGGDKFEAMASAECRVIIEAGGMSGGSRGGATAQAATATAAAWTCAHESRVDDDTAVYAYSVYEQERKLFQL